MVLTNIYIGMVSRSMYNKDWRSNNVSNISCNLYDCVV